MGSPPKPLVPPVASVAAGLTESGCYRQAAVQAVEPTGEGQPTGTTVDAAVEPKEPPRTVSDLAQKPELEPPGPEASTREVMKPRRPTAQGRARYKLRPQTGEPGLGIIKRVWGLRPFRWRGRHKVELAWPLGCRADNLKRLPRLGADLKMAAQG